MPAHHGLRFVLLAALAACHAGCGGRHDSVLIDPDAFGTDQGTLISLADVRTVSQEMILSMNASPQLTRLRAERAPLRILPGKLKQRTSIAIFDKELFSNRLLSSLDEGDRDGFYVFLRRDVASTAPQTGADLVLAGEIRELLHREEVEEGGEREKRTIQYALSLTRVSDAAILWTRSQEIVKEQVTGVVYR